MSLKNKYERVIIRNNMSLGLSSCAYEYLLNLEQENQQLEERIKQYENPEDLTLMFMYCEENAKDKIKELQQENQQLKKQLKQKDEVIDKAINHINSIYGWRKAHIDTSTIDVPLLTLCEELLEILQKYKGDNNE